MRSAPPPAARSRRPDRDDANPAGTGDRTATFSLLNDVALRGGFAGIGEPDPNARNIVNFVTVLTGDLNGDDGPGFANNGDNARHVVTAPTGTTATAILDGVTVTAGHAEGATNRQRSGGGLHIDTTSSPTIIDSTFAGNAADLYGGGASTRSFSSTPTLTRCTFVGNHADQGGGGMYNLQSLPRITCCRFLSNTASQGAGMMNHDDADAVLTNCLFAGNAATTNGGAISNLTDIYATISSCTFTNNSAGTSGGGLYNNSNGSPRVRNSILWGNTDAGGSDASAQMHVGNGSPILDFCCVQGGWAGAGADNLALDPLFADADGPDNDPDTVADNDYRLTSGSPAVDAGRSWLSPADVTDEDGDGDQTELIPVDLVGIARFADEMATPDTGCGVFIIDVGAFESPGPSVNPMRIGDTNGDGVVGFGDILAVIGQWGPCDGCCVGDIDGNGNVGFEDILAAISNWG